MTLAGVILGTAAYMSPEQAKGRVVDKRSDVWAFGCVLFEMLTGRRAFEGEDVTDTIAAIVRGEPDWKALPADTPPQIRLMLQRCLEKDRRARISDIGVTRFLMNETIAPPPEAVGSLPGAAAGSRRGLVVGVAIGLAVGGVLAAATWAARSSEPPRAAPVRFVFAPPPSQPLIIQGDDRDVAIAPDGSFIVYRSGSSAQTQPSFSVRGVNELEPRFLPGTTNGRSPFISPDGRWVGFQVGSEIRKVAIAGGPATVICRISGGPRGVSWGDDDFIVFGTPNGLQRVAAGGGEPTPLTSIDPNKVEQHVLPHVLPGSRWVVFTVFPGSDYLAARLEALEVATGRRKVLLAAGQDAAYVDSGHLVYGLTTTTADAESRFQASLRAVRFDPGRVEVIGEPLTVVESVRVGTSPTVNYSVSRRGDLVFVPGGGSYAPPAARTLTWVNRKGQETAIGAPPRTYAMARISPDGTRVALDVRDQHHGHLDLGTWTADAEPIEPSRRAGSEPDLDTGRQASDLDIHARRRESESVLAGGRRDGRSGASDDSRQQSVSDVDHAGRRHRHDVWCVGRDCRTRWICSRLAMKDPARKAEPLLSAAGMDFGPEVSPDGKWLAYHSNISGEFQVYVRPFPNVQDGRSQVSTDGGTRAAWSRNGRELFYLDREGLLTSVAVPAALGATFAPGPPVKILTRKYYAGASILGLDLRGYDVASDGQRFLMIKEPESAGATLPPVVNMVVVVNWMEELKERLPAR